MLTLFKKYRLQVLSVAGKDKKLIKEYTATLSGCGRKIISLTGKPEVLITFKEGVKPPYTLYKIQGDRYSMSITGRRSFAIFIHDSFDEDSVIHQNLDIRRKELKKYIRVYGKKYLTNS